MPAGRAGSALNRLEAEVHTHHRARQPRAPRPRGAGQPLAAEVTLASTHRLALREGSRVVATWKAAATRLVGR